mmetsp:Transcript_9574/g.13207  ORF Transcript_9574/g.13207 Transcript_9574/m.13207 type:complete len:128 (+) Transcript_9574:1115-1498(+)
MLLQNLLLLPLRNTYHHALVTLEQLLFVELANDEDTNDQNVSFVYDTEGERQQSFKCPNNIEEMLLIVRQLQSQLEKALPTFEFTDPNRTSLYNTETNWSNTSQSRFRTPTTSKNKNATNNYDQDFN